MARLPFFPSPIRCVIGVVVLGGVGPLVAAITAPGVTHAQVPSQEPTPGADQEQTHFVKLEPRVPMPERFPYTVDPKMPLLQLLPAPPTNALQPARPWVEDLMQVSEIQFQEPLSAKLEPKKAKELTAAQLAKMRHLDAKKAEGFLEALIAQRADLQGLPFLMGDACRSPKARMDLLHGEIALVRSALNQEPKKSEDLINPPPMNAGEFWSTYAAKVLTRSVRDAQAGTGSKEDRQAAQVAALSQILGPESAAGVGLVKHLDPFAHVDATQALARLAIFSQEKSVRAEALAALKKRHHHDATAILKSGLRYPLPTVAKRSAEALVALGRVDLAPELADLLDLPDPRLPVVKEVNKKQVIEVRELVRINHHRNCMLCHAAGQASAQQAFALPGEAQVPIPPQHLPSSSQGYRGFNSSPDLAVRIDVTYLRQDFSVLQPVKDAKPWPDMQRFDFLVRTRVVSEKEAEAIRQDAPKTKPGEPGPHAAAVHFALRELTGRDAAPTAHAWRALLKNSAKQSS